MADSPGALLDSLLSIMARLRGEGGCPWDRQQTRASLKPYLIEEAYEVVEAIDEGETGHLVEELGDLLFQIVFHCQLASEQRQFDMVDVLRRVTDKMTRRHPHVFGESVVADAQQALAQWERIKHAEGAADEAGRSVLDGVPRSLPALLRAQRLQVKAGRVGFDWADWEPAWAKAREEVGEVEEALREGDPGRTAEELGDLFFALVNVARLKGIDAEGCLRQAADKFSRRFQEVEAQARADGRTVADTPTEELDRAWEGVKAREGRPPRETER